jgi:two-component system response regulator VicR
VEDDPTVSTVLAAYLRREGFEVSVAADGREAEQRWQRDRPDLVVLDVMLPQLSGLEVLRRRRTAADAAAVIVVSARGEEEDRVVGLEFGADDYLVKPVSPRELVLRVHAVLRRLEGRLEGRLDNTLDQAGTTLRPRRIERGPVIIDTAARTARLGDETLRLTHREFDLLAFLAGHDGEAFTKAELLRRVWGWDFGDTSTVTVHVRRLREKIEEDPSAPRLVVTVPRTGYRFATADELAATGGSAG